VVVDWGYVEIRIIIFWFLAAFLTPAVAQPAAPPVESVTVTGERARDEQIKSFVQSRAAPSVRLGKIARWEVGICPMAAGLKPEFLKFIIQRVKDVATKAGAPVNQSPSCRTNIEIVFSTKPQAVLDNLRKSREDYLGYHANGSQADALARVTHVIQSWYVTATIDANGSVQLDSKKRGMPFCLDEPECRIITDVPPAAVTGSRLTDGLHSGFLNVIIVADPNKLVDHEVGALADYIAFVALAQPGSLDDCSLLPSILNLLARDCTGAAATREISEADTDYLHGLYHITPDALLVAQKGEIAYRMKQTLGGR
jgi:hypothetical protein